MPRLAIHADRGIVILMTNKVAEPRVGEVASCSSCGRELTRVRTVPGIDHESWTHTVESYDEYHVPTYRHELDDSHREIGRGIRCRCGEWCNLTDTGYVHDARSLLWYRACRDNDGNTIRPMRPASPDVMSEPMPENLNIPASALDVDVIAELISDSDAGCIGEQEINAHDAALSIVEHLRKGELVTQHVPGVSIPEGASVKDLSISTPAEALAALERVAAGYLDGSVPYQLMASIALMREFVK